MFNGLKDQQKLVWLESANFLNFLAKFHLNHPVTLAPENAETENKQSFKFRKLYFKSRKK